MKGTVLKIGNESLKFAFSTTYYNGDGPNVCYGRKKNACSIVFTKPYGNRSFSLVTCMWQIAGQCECQNNQRADVTCFKFRYNIILKLINF